MEEGHKIKTVVPGSIGEELELKPGDKVLAVNDQKIEDVFDYHYLINDEYIELTVQKADGEEWVLEIEKDEEEDLGIEFESSLMDYGMDAIDPAVRDYLDPVLFYPMNCELRSARGKVFDHDVDYRRYMGKVAY